MQAADPMSEVPVIDVLAYMNRVEGQWEEECTKVADSLHKFGILVFKDPRFDEMENIEYIEMMERYFKNRGEKYYKGEILKDAKPEIFYQAGVTPELKEKARNHDKMVAGISAEHKPLSHFPPGYDAKWRFFWNIGERPAEKDSAFPKVIPEDFPEWEEKMNTWGGRLLDAGELACEMAAIGMGLPANTFTDMMQKGPHLLAPTGSDLEKWDVGTAFAGFHYDLNFLTCHGKSRYPGLYVWLRDLKKAQVKVPAGCFLM